MADPLFLTDRDELLARMRLANLCSDAGGQEVVNRAIISSRSSLKRLLGLSTIDTLLATSYTDNPTTEAEYDRMEASLLECALVHKQLLLLMPQMAVESNGGGLEILEEEGMMRMVSKSDVAVLIQQLEEQIAEMVDSLVGDDNGGVHAMVVGGGSFDRTDPGNEDNAHRGAPRIGAAFDAPEVYFGRYRWAFIDGYYTSSPV